MTMARARAALVQLPPLSEHPRLNRPTPADRMLAAADATHGNALYGEGRVSDLRRHDEGTEAYLDRMASALQRAGYTVHRPGEELCVPYSQHAAALDALQARLDASDATLAALEGEARAAALAASQVPQEAPAAVVRVLAPVKPRKARSVPLPTAGSVAARLLHAYAEHAPLFGETGMTAAEATTHAGLEPGAWKRVSDLATLGLVGPLTEGGAHVTRRDGDRLPARVWVITPTGHTHLAALASAVR